MTLAITDRDVRDAIYGCVNTQWLANGTTATVPLLFEDAGQDQKPNGTDGNGNALPYALVSFRSIDGGQTSFGDVGNRRFEYSGVVTIQTFTASGQGGAQGADLTYLSRGFLSGKSSTAGQGRIHFRNARTEQIGKSGPYWVSNAVADFWYQEVA